MPVSLEHPWVLLLLPAAAAPWLLGGRAATGPARSRLLRALPGCGAILAVVLALAGPRVGLPADGPPSWLILQDVSDSVAGQADRTLQLPDWTDSRTVRFAAGLAGPGQPDPPGQQSRLGDALLLAAAQADQLAGVVVHTDGRADDDWQAAAGRLARTGLEVRVVGMQSPPPDARIVSLSARRLEGQALEVQIDLGANADQARRLEIRSNDAELLEAIDLRVQAHVPLRLVRRVQLPPQARATLSVGFAQPDAIAGNDRARLRIQPPGRRIGLIAPAGQVRLWIDLLERGGIPVVPLAAERVGDRLDGLTAVVLVDPAGQALDSAARRRLAAFVRTGGGLLLVGSGPRSSPAQRDDPLNRVLALRAQPYQRQALDVTVLLDASGSMGQRTSAGPDEPERRKFRLSADAVLSLQKHLTARDRLAVVRFSEAASLLYDSGPGRIDFAALADRLGRVEPDGATDVGPALALARQRAGRDDQRLHLVILVSDLQVEPFDPSAMLAWLQPDRRRLAVVAIGAADAEIPAALARLAEAESTRMVRREALQGLGAVFAELLSEVRGPGVLDRPVRGQLDQALWSVAPGALPALQRTIPSALAEGAEALAQVEWGTLLARRQVALGRSVGLAAWPAGATAEILTGSQQWRRLLLGAADWVQPGQADPRFDLRCRLAAGRVELTVRSASTDPGNLRAEILAGDDEEPTELPLRRVGPRRWQATGPVRAETVHLALRQNGRIVWSDSRSAAGTAELAGIGADWASLEALARRTGGRVVEPWNLAEAIPRAAPTRTVGLWPWLAGAGLGLMLLDWLVWRGRGPR